MMGRISRQHKKKYGGGVFRRNENEVYSISDRNKYGEYVVIKILTIDGETQMKDARIIKANDIKDVQQQIDKYPFELFPAVPDQVTH
jgi:hypothetical protein